MVDGSVNFEERLKQRIGRASRVESVAIRFTEDEVATLRQAAAERTTTVREWARAVLLREAQSRRTDALFTEIVATRMFLNLVLKHVACGEFLTAEAFSDVLTKVRVTKHKQALDMMAQYAAPDQKES
jgi:urate oxidase